MLEPRVFCVAARRELGQPRGDRDEGWVRAALMLCDFYQGTDGDRFAAVLSQLATGAVGSPTAEGARWLLSRWQAGQDEVSTTRVGEPTARDGAR